MHSRICKDEKSVHVILLDQTLKNRITKKSFLNVR